MAPNIGRITEFFAAQNPYNLTGLSTKIFFLIAASGAHTASWFNKAPSSI
jgi:hypothetical protein